MPHACRNRADRERIRRPGGLIEMHVSASPSRRPPSRWPRSPTYLGHQPRHEADGISKRTVLVWCPKQKTGGRAPVWCPSARGHAGARNMSPYAIRTLEDPTQGREREEVTDSGSPSFRSRLGKQGVLGLWGPHTQVLRRLAGIGRLATTGNI